MNVARVEKIENGGNVRTLYDAQAVEAHEDGAALLRDVEAFISRFVVLPPGALLPTALLAIGTNCFDVFETFPYLALLSPEKGCGKTRTTEVLEQIVAEPVRAVCISEAALFRLVEEKKPTLILDETEGLTGKGERVEAIRSLLNAGNRAGAQVPRCVGNSHELRFFSVTGLRSRLTPADRKRAVTVVLAHRDNLDVAIARALALAVEGELVQVVFGGEAQ